jgi:hypothetical protein
METTKITKRHENQKVAGMAGLTFWVREAIAPTLLFLVIFGAFRGFYFGIQVERSPRKKKKHSFIQVELVSGWQRC